jgi:hypothetical protein
MTIFASEKYYLPGSDTIKSDRNSMMSGRNILPPSSGLKSKPGKLSTRSR